MSPQNVQSCQLSQGWRVFFVEGGKNRLFLVVDVIDVAATHQQWIIWNAVFGGVFLLALQLQFNCSFTIRYCYCSLSISMCFWSWMSTRTLYQISYPILEQLNARYRLLDCPLMMGCCNFNYICHKKKFWIVIFGGFILFFMWVVCVTRGHQTWKWNHCWHVPWKSIVPGIKW